MGNKANPIARWRLSEEQILATCAMPEPNSGCWLWHRSFSPSGYGHLTISGKRVGAHRYMWSLRNKQAVPDGMQVHHSCDNPACVNPDHLSIGTNQKNALDMVARNRHCGGRVYGEANPIAKLTKEKVSLIMTSPLSGRRLGSILGVSYKTVNAVRSGQTWGKTVAAIMGAQK